MSIQNIPRQADTINPLVSALPIKGFQEVTLIDWDKKIASIIFLGGCNLRCGFCHSSSLAIASEKLETIPFEHINAFLAKKKGWIDGVVVTGGEPMLYKAGLLELARAIKKIGLLVKVDTNGTKPDTLREVIKSKLVDYIAMDIKSQLTPEKYARATGVKIEIDDIIASKEILLNSEIDYEFRTTLVPGIVDYHDIAQIAKTIKGAKQYSLQQFVPNDPIDKSFLNIKPYPADTLQQMLSVASEYVSNVALKNS